MFNYTCVVRPRREMCSSFYPRTQNAFLGRQGSICLGFIPLREMGDRLIKSRKRFVGGGRLYLLDSYYHVYHCKSLPSRPTADPQEKYYDKCSPRIWLEDKMLTLLAIELLIA